MKFNKLKTRRGKLEQKISTELSKSTPNIENIISAVESFEKDNLDTIEKLRKEKLYEARKISGALKSTIDAHGPITKILIGSATKRVYGSLISTDSKTIKREKIRRVMMLFSLTGITWYVWVLIKFIIENL